MQKLGDILKDTKNVDNDPGKHITREFQDYGYRLAVDLGDMIHKALYIKMAKEIDRKLLEEARQYVMDANVRNKGAVFMWKVKEIRKQQATSDKR